MYRGHSCGTHLAPARGGVELANGLPFVAADTTIHQLLTERTIDDCRRLQVALGKLRLASGHFQGKLLALDPHRVRSHSRRRMRERCEKRGQEPVKMAQTFWNQTVLLKSATAHPQEKNFLNRKTTFLNGGR